MKKFTLIALTLLLSFMGISQQAHAQYQQGDVLINGGLSLGLLGYGWGGYTRAGGLPALTVNVEYSLDDRFAVGPYIGYFSRTYKQSWSGGSYKHGFSAFAFGARGTAHATDLINEWFDASIDENKLDIYGSAQLGYEIYTWNYDDDLNDDFYPKSSTGGINLGLILGARYNFNEQVGAYFEFGRGTFGLATLGASFRL